MRQVTNIRLTPEEKASKIAELRKKHEKFLEDLGYDVLFLPKVKFPKGDAQQFISLFRSELKEGKDIYTEFVSMTYESEDATRTLYKWPYNPSWDEAYKKVQKTNSLEYYMIPVSELVPIHEVKEVDEVTFELPDPEHDAPIEQMTMRDEFAMRHLVPVSQKKWLNELIKSTNKTK